MYIHVYIYCVRREEVILSEAKLSAKCQSHILGSTDDSGSTENGTEAAEEEEFDWQVDQQVPQEPEA